MSVPRIVSLSLSPSLRRLGMTAALAALAVRAPGVHAQEPADTFALGELVVTASRLPTPRAAVPAAVTVLDGQALRARGLRFVADALRRVPGAAVVRTGSEGGVTSLFLRGGESDYVQLLVDGVAVNDPGGAIDLGQLTLDEVERIEIVRGPVSVLYGSDAVTGVVHVITRRGAGRPRVHASAGVGVAGRRVGEASICPGFPRTPCPDGADLGSYGTRGWELGVSGSARALDYTLGGSGFDSDGAYADNNEYENRALAGRVGLAAGGADGSLSARYTDGLFHYPTDGAGRLADANTYRSSESLALGLELGGALTSRLEARAAVSYHDGDYVTVDEPDTPADTLGFYASTTASRVDRRKANLHANLRVASAVATLGLELERQEGESDFTSRSQFGPFESSTADERSNRALYGQIHIAPPGRLSATGGVRREDNDRFGSFVTWRAGSNLRVGPATRVRASAGTAFKEPTFFENFAEGFTVGNPALEPERSRSWEVGVEQHFASERARFAGTWFDQRFKNLIQYTATPAPGSPNYVNIGAATARGLELEVGAELGAATVDASWVHLLTEVVDAGFGTDQLFQQGERLLRRPGERVNVEVAGPLGARVDAGAALTVVGERDDLDFLDDFNGARLTLPGYAVVDLHTDVRILAGDSRDLGLRVRLENALDEDYREVANYPAPGRRLSVALHAGAGL